MIYGVEVLSRLIFEIRPMGDHILIRPAEAGFAHLIERIDFHTMSLMFDPFTAKFLIPNRLDDDDFAELMSGEF